MESIKVYSKKEYGPVRSNEAQSEHMATRRGRDIVPFYSKDELHCRIVDIPSELWIRLCNEMKSPIWLQESESVNLLEKYAGITTDNSDVCSDIMKLESRKWYTSVGYYLKPLLESWIDQPLILRYVYGPRRYRRGAVLLNHIDINEYTISATITLDVKLDEPWPLTCEIEDKVVEIYLEPGQMLFYEGRSTPHARPKPLNGDYYINFYSHYYLMGE